MLVRNCSAVEIFRASSQVALVNRAEPLPSRWVGSDLGPAVIEVRLVDVVRSPEHADAIKLGLRARGRVGAGERHLDDRTHHFPDRGDDVSRKGPYTQRA